MLVRNQAKGDLSLEERNKQFEGQNFYFMHVQFLSFLTYTMYPEFGDLAIAFLDLEFFCSIYSKNGRWKCHEFQLGGHMTFRFNFYKGQNNPIPNYIFACPPCHINLTLSLCHLIDLNTNFYKGHMITPFLLFI